MTSRTFAIGFAVLGVANVLAAVTDFGGHDFPVWAYWLTACACAVAGVHAWRNP
jgi:hypothetical protein